LLSKQGVKGLKEAKFQDWDGGAEKRKTLSKEAGEMRPRKVKAPQAAPGSRMGLSW